MKKFFRPISIGSATALISLTSLISYAIGLIRDRVIAVNFGTTSATDTYNASFLIPDMLFNLFIAGALAAAFLPVFSDYLTKNREEAYKIANSILTGGLLLISGLAVLAFIFMEHIIPFIFTDIPPELQRDIINMTRLMLPSAILFTLSNTLGNILMSYKHFISYSLSPILYNLGIILGVIFLSEQHGIYSAAIGVLIGAVFHCAVRIVDTLATDYRYRLQTDFSHPGFKKIIRLMIPKAFSLIAWQINLYIFAFIGIRLIEGGLAAFNFARNIQSFAVSLFGIAFATAVFPYLTASISENNHQAYTSHIQKTAQRILFFTIPAMTGLMIMARPIVEIILSGGIFNENSIRLTSLILFYFAFSIPFESLVHIFARAYYARQNTITPMIINIFAMTLVALSTIFLAPRYGIYWFSLGFSLATALQVFLLILFLRRHFREFAWSKFFTSIAKTILASTLMIVPILWSAPLLAYLPLRLGYVLQIVLGGTTFFLIAYLLKSDELASVHYITSRIFKKKNNENF